ncbi:hypothetical protein ACFQ1S_38295, partial [Kibdelosporangium lantanae]
VRKGFTGHLDVEAVREEITRVNAVGLEVTEFRYRTRVTGQAPCYQGWSLLAALDWDQHAGLIVRTAPGVQSVNRSTLVQGWCAHCRKNRHRTKTYLLGHADGRQVQVGSTCLKDFLGWDGRVVFLSTDDVESEIGSIFGGLGGFREFTVLTVLAAAWAVIKTNGYVRSREMGATADCVWSLIDPCTSDERKAAEAFRPFIADATAMAAQVRDWVLSDEFAGTSEYVTNLKAVCGA